MMLLYFYEIGSSAPIPIKSQVGNKFTVLAKQYHFDGAENGLVNLPMYSLFYLTVFRCGKGKDY